MATSHYLTDVASRERPQVRRITTADVFAALREGFEDFRARPSHYVFIGLMYPIAGMVLIAWSVGFELLPMVYPLMSGFAIVGPVLALGLYEISRRRDEGEDAGWAHALDVLRSAAWPSILAMTAWLTALFIAWLVAAQWLYFLSFGDLPQESVVRFVSDVMAASNGWTLIVWGNVIGFVFALVALATSIVAFPLLLDREAGVAVAIETSIRATIANPVPVALWGLVVAGGLILGFATLMVGLAVIVPILGHATWHLYRKLVAVPAPGEVRTLTPRASDADGRRKSAA